MLKDKLLHPDILAQQVANNTKEQLANSPDLFTELLNAIMDAVAAHTSMSKQALNSKKVGHALKDILLRPAQLYEARKGKGSVH